MCKDTGKGKTPKTTINLWMPVDDDATFWRTKSPPSFLTNKRLRKHKNNNETFDNQPWKTKNNNNQTVDAGKGKTKKTTINLWMPVDDAMFQRVKSPPSFLTKKDQGNIKTTTKPSPINLEKQKTTTIKQLTRRWQRKDTKNNKATFNGRCTFVLDACCHRRLIVFHFWWTCEVAAFVFKNQSSRKTKNNNNQGWLMCKSAKGEKQSTFWCAFMA